MHKDNKKYLPLLFFLIILYIFLFIFFGLNGFLNSNDNGEHKKMALDNTHNTVYKSWYRVISQFFVSNEFTWFLFPALITIGFTTYFVYRLGGIWAGLVFFASTYFFSILGAGLYPQGLVTMLLLAFFVFSKWWQRIPIVLLGVFAHSTGILLFISTVLLILCFYFLKKHRLGLFSLACSPIFGKNVPIFLEKDISLQASTAEWALNYNDLASFFVKGFSFPFFVFGLKGLLKNKEFVFVGLIVFSFVGAFALNSRVLLFSIPFLCIGFGKEFHLLKHKKLWMGLMVLLGAYHWFQFFLLRWLC